ncbi:MAG: cobalt-precorrin-5B (C(1))-methyltransferase CbiD [candidate division WOR-3 bacterium]|nr:cobalt-precorrin-5B (C(1))-methyltransferase CbiD [candidate division WOR-3 bacterium]
MRSGTANPVPVKMILKEVNEVLPEGRGVEIILSAPGGEEIAKQTYNPKLGIVGGISILGTTGIVNPMSEEAWKDSLAAELSVMAAQGVNRAVFTFGNYGESFAVDKLCIDKRDIIKISNFVGFMLDKAVEYGIQQILLIGHLGKLVKVAAGIFHTHSRVADARMEILAAYAALEGGSENMIKEIYHCRTTEAAAEIIKNNGLHGVFERIVFNASKRCGEYTLNKIHFGTVLFNEDNTLLSMDETAKNMIEG